MFLLLTLFACLDPDAPNDPADTESYRFEVPKGSTPAFLGQAMVEQGFIGGELQWKLYTRQRDTSCLKAGTFELSRSMSLNEVLDTVCGTPLADDVAFTVIEGWRIRDTDAALAEAGLIEAGSYVAVATSKAVEAPFDVGTTSFEGFLYPETYMVPAAGVDPAVLVKRQLDTFNERFASKHESFGGRTLDELLAINERESVEVADSFLRRPFLKNQVRFLRSRKKWGPAAMFLGLYLTQPLWSRLI